MWQSQNAREFWGWRRVSRNTSAACPQGRWLSSMDGFPDGLSDSKPEFSVCAKARSRADNDLLAITEAKEEREKKE